MRAGLNDLQRQFATGKKADNYAGIGPSRGLTVGMRNQLSGIEGFSNTVDLWSKLRVNVASTSADRDGQSGAHRQAGGHAVAVRA